MLNKVTISPSEKNPMHGIGFVIFMTICFSSLDASAKYLSNELPLWVLLWGRYVFNFLFVALFFIRGAPADILRTRKIKLQILRSILLVASTLTFWLALMFLPLVDCVVVLFVSPILVTMLAAPLLGESVGRHRWIAVIIGFVGVMVVMRPGFTIFDWMSILPLITALFYAGVQISTRILGRTDGALTTLLYSSAGGAIISTIGVLFFWVTPSLGQWFVLGWLGFLGALGHYLMIKAYEIAPASLLAPFDYTTLIWATILGFIAFGDLPDTWTVLGALIIMSSGLYLIRRESRLVVV
ncbi:MAG: DMT family transporter [Desulfobacteraceae bacterium]|jgi:drug/metabolite transporter (DMT)-like permease|nr:DMT family transporter [Desulfobacterales bacterium]MDH3877813.1 DMT family transporter [Desulfobacterales bacterium]MDH3956615.1 DMT family transporter [Desulfobacteraceae bacterium]